MPLFALHDTYLISAFDAETNASYFCLECQNPLKLRKQKRKLPHFYHLRATPSCRLYSKSNEHLLIQLAIQKSLPPNEGRLEHHFPSIRRIADVSWEKKKIVFEIQCSLISEEEVKQRSQDYASLNYQIVWILDDRLFNKKIIQKTEHYLRTRLCYFAELHPNLLFYDQFEVIQFPKRLRKGPKIPILLHQVHPMKHTDIPQVKQRVANNCFYFENDLVHKALLIPKIPSYGHTFNAWSHLESKQIQCKRFSCLRWIQKIYFQLLKKALQKISRQ